MTTQTKAEIGDRIVVEASGKRGLVIDIEHVLAYPLVEAGKRPFIWWQKGSYQPNKKRRVYVVSIDEGDILRLSSTAIHREKS